jgi:DNA adenine methylase
MMKINAILPYFGGKRTLAPEIVREFGEHRAYWEPFCGSLAVLMAKDESSQETVNDQYGLLINLARCLQHPEHGPWLYRQLRRTLVHEGLFQEAAQHCKQGSPLDGGVYLDAQMAYWFFVCSWLGRNGVIGTKGANNSWSTRYTANGGIQGTRFVSAVDSIPAWRRRLREVTILRRDAFELLEKIEDADSTVIYCDPPYVAKGAKYVHDFEAADHARLAKVLGRFKHARVVVSYYAHPALTAMYEGWTVRNLAATKSLVQAGAREKGKVAAPEILLINGPSLVEGQLF